MFQEMKDPHDLSPRTMKVLEGAAERRATKVAEMRARGKVVAIQAGDLSGVQHQQAHTYRETLLPGTNMAIFALNTRGQRHVWWARLQGFDNHLNAHLRWWEQSLEGDWSLTYEQTMPPTALLGVANPGHAPRTYLWLLPVDHGNDLIRSRALALCDHIRVLALWDHIRAKQEEPDVEPEVEPEVKPEVQAPLQTDLISRRHISMLGRIRTFLSARDARAEASRAEAALSVAAPFVLAPFDEGDFHLPPLTQMHFVHIIFFLLMFRGGQLHGTFWP